MAESLVHNKGKCNNFMLKSRVWFSGLVCLHMVFLLCNLLPIDFSELDEPKLKLYERVKWKLITTWVNLIMTLYYPLSFYCDWQELRGSTKKHVQVLNKIRHLCFHNILFPATMFADTLFWRIWSKDRELLAPHEMDKYIPFWTYHCLHTVSLVVILVDLIIVPRKKPDSTIPGMMMMFTFITTYLTMSAVTQMRGDFIYPMFGIFPMHKLILFGLSMYLEHLLYFSLQWLVIDYRWGEKKNSLKKY